MPVPSSITDCNSTAANNSPAGSDSIGTSLDDYLRSHAAILRQVYDALVAVDATLLPKAGGTVTGTITTTHQIKGITPVAAEDLTRKDYVDGKVTTASSGPAFAAQGSLIAPAVNVPTKAPITTEVFDTNTNYDAANSRFTPTVAGYYQVNADGGNRVALATFGIYVIIYKNNTEVVAQGGSTGNDVTFARGQASGLIYMNGTTDYLEVYLTVTGPSGTAQCICDNFSAFLARPA